MPRTPHRRSALPLMLTAGLLVCGCRSISGPMRPERLPSASTTTTTDHIERVLDCEEAERMWLDAVSGLEQDLAADPTIAGAASVGELERRLGALVSERTDRFAGLAVEPGC